MIIFVSFLRTRACHAGGDSCGKSEGFGFNCRMSRSSESTANNSNTQNATDRG